MSRKIGEGAPFGAPSPKPALAARRHLELNAMQLHGLAEVVPQRPALAGRIWVPPQRLRLFHNVRDELVPVRVEELLRVGNPFDLPAAVQGKNQKQPEC